MQVKVVKPGANGAAARDFGAFDVPDGASVADLKRAFEQATRISRHRQNFKLPDAAGALVSLADDSRSLASYGVASGAALQFKDLGPQIGYRTVFVAEYLGPLALVLLLATRPAAVYGAGAAGAPWDPVARLGVLAWTAHFAKRELESVFVHRFSRATMPLRNLFKNCGAYWTFAALIGYQLAHPAYRAPASPLAVRLGLALFGAAELLNGAVHLQLRALRPAEGSTARPVPTGPLFALVSCPNYTFEALAWVGFSLATQVSASYAFTAIGFLQMSEWALKKHRAYLRAEGDAYKKLRRKAIVPFVL